MKKLYFVEALNDFIVKANSKKEAIDTIWNLIYKLEKEEAIARGEIPMYKYEITATELNKYFEENAVDDCYIYVD